MLLQAADDVTKAVDVLRLQKSDGEQRLIERADVRQVVPLAFARDGFRGCPYVNAVTELSDPRHPAAAIALQFKEERRVWFRGLLERLNVKDPEGLATQMQLLVEGALVSAVVRGDATPARAARAAAEVLLAAAARKR